MKTAVTRLLAAGAVALAGLTATAMAAHAAPTTVTAHTAISNRPDSGNGGTWAYDDFGRTLTVTLAAVQNPADTAKHLTDYTATVTDNGDFHAIIGTDTPNQVVPGLKIASGVSGEMHGSITYTITAPSTDTLTGTVPATENDNFGAPAVTTGNWPAQAFATSAGVTVTEGSTWSWTYSTRCETWVDSSANGDGNLAGDGNITGKSCTPPVKHPKPHGHSDNDRDDHGHHGRGDRD